MKLLIVAPNTEPAEDMLQDRGALKIRCTITPVEQEQRFDVERVPDGEVFSKSYILTIRNSNADIIAIIDALRAQQYQVLYKRDGRLYSIE